MAHRHHDRLGRPVNTPTPRRSGWCGTGNPPESHARCTGHLVRGPGLDPLSCSCLCHQEPAPALADVPPAPVAPVGREQGFYDDIAEEDYHRDPHSLSHSGAKTLLKAPALFRHEQQHPVFKKVFDFGSAAHAKVLGVGAEIRVIPPAMLASNGAASTKEAKAFIAEARASGAIALKPDEAQQVDDMAEQISRHRLAAELLSEGQAEVSAYARDEATGILRRCRFDWLGPAIATDYKSAVSADPNAFRKSAADFGYHQQHAWYLDVARELGHTAAAFAFIVQMKTPPYLVSVVELVPAAVERGRELNQRALEIYRDCTATDHWPGFVRDDAFASIDLPPWAYYDNDLEVSA